MAYGTDGRIQSKSGVTGVYSQIYTYGPPYVPVGGFSYAWVMLPGPANWEWAQIGANAVSGGARETLIQYAWSSTQIHNIHLAAKAIGSFHYYDIDYEPTFHRHTFFIDGSQVASVDVTQWTPVGAQIVAEVWLLDSQMMGGRNDREAFRDNHISYSGADHSFAGTVVNSNTSRYDWLGTADSFTVWDRACA
jgi:hypothetical protein